MWSKSWFKVLMVVILQIALSIPIYLLATFLLPNKLKQGLVYENIVIIVLYSAVLYLCLSIISNKLVKEDINKFSRQLAAVAVASEIVGFIISGGLGIEMVAYPLIAYFGSYYFIKNKFKNTDNL